MRWFSLLVFLLLFGCEKTKEQPLKVGLSYEHESHRNRYFSSSLDNVRLSVDYRKYDHFVRFGSAEERLKNFRYKLSQIEYYDEKIADLSYNALATASNSDVTGSYYHTKNVDNFKTQKNI